MEFICPPISGGTKQTKKPIDKEPSIMDEAREIVRPIRSFNSYGLFRVMTRTRPEIVIEGSSDGEHWETYHFRWKPTDLNRRPGWAGPHMPRIDWQMWFEGSECRTARRSSILAFPLRTFSRNHCEWRNGKGMLRPQNSIGRTRVPSPGKCKPNRATASNCKLQCPHECLHRSFPMVREVSPCPSGGKERSSRSVGGNPKFRSPSKLPQSLDQTFSFCFRRSA